MTAYLGAMQKPTKALAVRFGTDGLIHLAHPRNRPAAGGAIRLPRQTFCGKTPATPVAGNPTSHAATFRCPECYAAVDPYG